MTQSRVVIMSGVLILESLVSFGCATYRPKPIDQAFRWRTLSDAGLHRFVAQHLPSPPAAWPPAEWRLETLMRVASYYHPDLEFARARLAKESWMLRSATTFGNEATQ